MKKNKLIICVISLIIIFSIISLIFVSIETNRYTKIKIFDSISELYVLDELKIDEISTEKDNYLLNQEYVDKYLAKVCFKNVNYNIFAYEFSDFTEANIYYSNITGVILKDSSKNFKLNSNAFKTNITVINDSKVFRIEGKNIKDFNLFREYLNSFLTITIRD